MKKVLMISYHFPPEEGSCSDKNQKMLSALLDAGMEVEVLTVGVEAAGETFLGAPVLRVGGGVFHKRKNTGCASGGTGTGSGSKLKRFVQKNCVPDPVIDWYPKVTRWAKQADMERYGAILSISSPYSVHLISRKLSKTYGIPYLCAYGDPWVYEPSRKRGAARYRMEYQMEKKVVRDARKVLLITEYNRQRYQQLYGLEPEKVDTYQIGFADTAEEKKSTGGPMRWIYGGSLNPVHRNAEPFLRAVSGMTDMRVDIYNADFPELPQKIRQFGGERTVTVRPLLPAKDFRRELYASDVLLLFGNRTTFQIPGKLYEFIETGTHILYIKNNEASYDASEAVLRQYGNVTVTQNDPETIRQAVASIRDRYRMGTLNAQCHREAFAYHKTMASVVKAVRETLEP